MLHWPQGDTTVTLNMQFFGSIYSVISLALATKLLEGECDGTPLVI